MQNTLFRSSFRLCYNSCRRHCPRRKPLHAVTHKILAGETDEKKNAFSTKLAFCVDFFDEEGNRKTRGKPSIQVGTETQPTNNRRDESRDWQPLRQCDSRDFQIQNRKKNKVYSVYFIYVYSIYAVDVICWENPTKCMLYSTLRNAIMSFHQNSQSKQKRIYCLLKDKRYSPFDDLLSLEGLLACCISCF